MLLTRYEYDYMSSDAINLFRIKLGLDPIVRGKRKCMCCQELFQSEDVSRIRICQRCKNLSEQGGIPECSIHL